MHASCLFWHLHSNGRLENKWSHWSRLQTVPLCTEEFLYPQAAQWEEKWEARASFALDFFCRFLSFLWKRRLKSKPNHIRLILTLSCRFKIRSSCILIREGDLYFLFPGQVFTATFYRPKYSILIPITFPDHILVLIFREKDVLQFNYLLNYVCQKLKKLPFGDEEFLPFKNPSLEKKSSSSFPLLAI